MLKPANARTALRRLFTRWTVYSRAYILRCGIPNPFWFIVLRLRESVFKSNAITACQYMSRGVILDVGTGPGRQLSLLGKMAPNIGAVGVDTEPVLIADARRRVHQEDLGNRITFLLADVHALPFASRSFDMVTSTMSLHQWRDQRKGIMEIRRVLKDGGFVVVLVGSEYVKKETILRSFEAAGFSDLRTMQKNCILQVTAHNRFAADLTAVDAPGVKT